jgi:hypothetical protein
MTEETAPIAPSETPPTAALTQSGLAKYIGNSYDLIALIAAITGLFSLGTCFLGLNIYCLPIMLGIIGLIAAKQSADPSRTRTLSIIGIATTAFLLLLILAIILAYVGFVIVMIIASTGIRRE